MPGREDARLQWDKRGAVNKHLYPSNGFCWVCGISLLLLFTVYYRLSVVYPYLPGR